MARIPDQELTRLKQEVSLARLVETWGVELKPHGNDLMGRCPFHDDKEPSLIISPQKNLWHCLGACQTGGSVIDWVMKAEGVSFRHAVELLREGHLPLAAKNKWVPLFIEQKEKPKIIFLSITKMGIIGDHILISYIFPFHLLLSQIRISRNVVESYTEEKKLGKKFLKLRLKQPNNGAIFVPMKMKTELEKLLSS